MIPISHYSGAGNTFLIVDNRKGQVPLHALHSMCETEETDGVLLLEESHVADYRMRIFNRDGKEAEMCGNGLRCFIHYLRKLSIFLPLYRIETKAGLQKGWVEKETICTELPPPKNLRLNIQLKEFSSPLHHLNTGVPHTIQFVESLDPLDVEKKGQMIRNHPFFAPEGTNVNFVLLQEEGISIRTYERGVERETLACGTGAAASAIIAGHLFNLPFPLSVGVRSREHLKIFLKDDFITIHGPATHLRDALFAINKESSILAPL